MHSKAERFFRKALKASHNQEPRVINVDKNAAYPPALDELKADQTLSETTELRPVKYLNNIVEQDHRFIKRLAKPPLANRRATAVRLAVNPGMGFGSFNTARRTLRGYEAMNMLRKGQIQGIEKGNILGQVEYARENFRSGWITRAN